MNQSFVCNVLFFGFVTEPSRSFESGITEKDSSESKVDMDFVHFGLELGVLCD